jgi:hypothetical protein
MHEHGADADALGSDRDAAKRIRQQIGPKPAARVIAADRQTPDYRNRNRIRRIAPHLARSGRSLNSPGGNAEIGDGPIAVANDIGTGESALILESALL